MRIVIMGSGGTGAYYGAKLAQAGHSVTFVARGAHLQAMQTQGLGIQGVENFHLPQVTAVSSLEGQDPADFILFATKAYDTEGAAHTIKPVVGPNTTVLPIQNGVESYQRIGAIVGHKHVIAGLCRISAEIAGPGVIALHSPFCQINLGEMDRRPSARTEALAKALNEAGVPTEVSADIQADLWRKFAFITAFSGVTGATRSTIGPIRECAETFAIYRRIAEEVVAVGKAEGVDLGAEFVDMLVMQAQGLPPGMKASLLVDLEHNKRTEVETLQGTVVALGRKHSVPTPVTETIYGLIKLHQPK